ncbi:MAG: hypothetical protein ACUVQP_05605 [Bacteroidales bacterium]
MTENEFEVFKKTWEDLITKIENGTIDGDGVNLIRIRFELDKSRL